MQVVHGMASAFKGLSLKDTQDSHSDRVTEDCRTSCVAVMLGCFVQLSSTIRAAEGQCGLKTVGEELRVEPGAGFWRGAIWSGQRKRPRG